MLEKENTVKPGFNKEACHSFFKKTTRNKKKWKHEFPDWMKKLNEHLNVFDLKKFKYKEITCFINKLKSSGSPCPPDQISITILKRCSILRTFIDKIRSHCWRERKFSSCWKHAFTILIYKKGFSMELPNFHPIRLQPVFAKIYSLLMRNRIHNFFFENFSQISSLNFFSGTYRKVSGEQYQGQKNTKLLTHIIKHAKNKQRQIIVTLLDPKNACGEVDHILLKVLVYHHSSDIIKLLISDYYKSYTITISTNTYITDPLIVGKWVFQGGCLSLLLFNMIINTLIKTIDDERICRMEYNFCNSLTPRNWFQFVDDSVLVMSIEQDNQLLLNLFTKWCNWAILTARVDKFKIFGIRKNGT